MNKRMNGTSGQEPGPKRSRGDASGSSEGREFYLEQRLVGWIIGRGGGTLKEIEQANAVKITADQSSKDLGYSRLVIDGSDSNVLQAIDHINNSLSKATAGDAVGPFLLDHPPFQMSNSYEEFQIKQRYIGWLLGRSGAVIRDIEQASGCKICINQDSKGLGYSIAQLHGSPEVRAQAKFQIEESIERAKASGDNKPSEETMEIEQKWVGWLLGRGGGIVREIEKESGASITIDQATKGLGFSTVRLSGTATQVDQARERVVASLEKAGAAPLTGRKTAAAARMAGSLVQTFPAVPSFKASAPKPSSSVALPSSTSTQIQVQQEWVGWLLGKSGGAIRDMEASTGAKIGINQDTKAQGFSTATLSGSPAQIVQAYDMMDASLRKVTPNGKGLSPLPAVFRGAKSAPPLAAPPLRGKATSKGSDNDLSAAVVTLATTLVQNLGSGALSQALPALQVALGNKPELAAVLTSLAAAPVAPSRSATNRGNGGAMQAVELQIEQKFVGWLLGSGGKTIREIEAETGAKISIDQSSKDMGYSTVQVSGVHAAVQFAQQRIQASLQLINPSTQEDHTPSAAELQVEQRYVGWLLGKSGIVLREIEMQSGAKVTIDQSMKDMGFSTVKVTGNTQQLTAAQQLIQDKIAQATSS